MCIRDRFVNKVQYVNNANEEIDALDSIIPTETAVVDARFKDVLKGATESYKDSLSSICLTSYAPNRLTYETNNAQDGIAVFSEIYYPDVYKRQRADVLLLLLRHPFLCGSLLRESMAYQDIAPVLQGKCRTDCGRYLWSLINHLKGNLTNVYGF